MRRFGALLLLTIALLAGCGGRESPVSPDEAPERRTDSSGNPG